MAAEGSAKRRNGKLRIPLPFEEALKAATEVKPPSDKAERKPRPRDGLTLRLK